MAGRGSGPDFVESLARGLDVLRCFDESHRQMSLADVATATGLARPTARRLLLTLAELGYVRSADGAFSLTPRCLTLGTAYVASLGLWEIARPHLEALVRQTGESSSMAQLDGSDIVYVARVSVPKLIALRVDIGTLFPAPVTSQGKVLLAALSEDDLARVLAIPSRSSVEQGHPSVEQGHPSVEQGHPSAEPGHPAVGQGHPLVGQGHPLVGQGHPLVEPVETTRLHDDLTQVRARGWALADEELAPGVRSVAVPVRDGTGTVRAAMNVTVHAAETSTETLLDRHLPKLLQAAGNVSADWSLWWSRPHAEV
jgi:IclR family pca regulon transcriptional regulator